MAIPSISKGFTSPQIPLALSSDFDYTDCTLVVEFCGVRRSFENLTTGATVPLDFTADETCTFPLGTSHVYLSLHKPSGEIIDLPWAKIKVTDCDATITAPISIDPSALPSPSAAAPAPTVIPAIMKGETSRAIPLALAEGFDFSACTLIVDFCGVQKSFTGLVSGGIVSLVFSAEETETFPLGTSRAYLSLRNAAGEVRHLPWAKIKVTDCDEDVFALPIRIDPGALDVDDLTAADSLGSVKSRLNAVMAFLRALKSLAVCALPLAALANVEPAAAPLDDIPGTTPIVTNVAAVAPSLASRAAALSNDLAAVAAVLPAKADTTRAYTATNDYFTVRGDGLRLYPVGIGDYGVADFVSTDNMATLRYLNYWRYDVQSGELVSSYRWRYENLTTGESLSTGHMPDNSIPLDIDFGTKVLSRVDSSTENVVYSHEMASSLDSKVDIATLAQNYYGRTDIDDSFDAVTNKLALASFWLAPDGTRLDPFIYLGQVLYGYFANDAALSPVRWRLYPYEQAAGNFVWMASSNSVQTVTDQPFRMADRAVVTSYGTFTHGTQASGVAYVSDITDALYAAVTAIDATAEPTVDKIWEILCALKRQFEALKEEYE